MRTTLLVVALGLTSSIASADPDPEPAQPLTIIDTIHPKAGRVIWHPISGDRVLSEPDFYHLVGRDDLAHEVQSHRTRATVAGVGSALALGFSFYELVQTMQQPDLKMCFGASDLEACSNAAQARADADGHTHVMPAIAGGAVSLGLVGYMIYELATTPTMSGYEAHAAADRYNASHVVPYASPGGGGVSYGGSF